jgi:hypothetical protein
MPYEPGENRNVTFRFGGETMGQGLYTLLAFGVLKPPELSPDDWDTFPRTAAANP